MRRLDRSDRPTAASSVSANGKPAPCVRLLSMSRDCVAAIASSEGWTSPAAPQRDEKLIAALPVDDRVAAQNRE